MTKIFKRSFLLGLATVFVAMFTFGIASCKDESDDGSTTPPEKEYTKIAADGTTNLQVAAGETLECVIDAESGSYEISWTHPKAKVQVGDGEILQKTSDMDLNDPMTAAVMYVEDEVIVKVTNTDIKKNTFAIECDTWSAPDLELDALNEDLSVSAGTRGSLYQISAMNPGRYEISTTSNVSIALTSDGAYSPATVNGTTAYIDVKAFSTINVTLTHTGTQTIEIDLNVIYDTDVLTVVAYSEERPTETHTVSVAAGEYTFGLITFDASTTFSWTESDLVISVNNVVYDSGDVVTVELDSFNRAGTYFVAWSKGGNALTDVVLSFTTVIPDDLEAKTYTDLTVLPKTNNEYLYKFTQTGTYTLTISGDNVKSFSVAYSGKGLQPLDCGDALNGTGSIVVKGFKGTGITVNLQTSASVQVTVDMTVSYTAPESTALTSGTPITLTESSWNYFTITEVGTYTLTWESTNNTYVEVYLNGVFASNNETFTKSETDSDWYFVVRVGTIQPSTSTTDTDNFTFTFTPVSE